MYGFCTFCNTKLQILQHMQAQTKPKKGPKKIPARTRLAGYANGGEDDGVPKMCVFQVWVGMGFGGRLGQGQWVPGRGGSMGWGCGRCTCEPWCMWLQMDGEAVGSRW